jgi:hypothetical protein
MTEDKNEGKALDPPTKIKNILIPEYLPAFCKSIAAMPTVHAAKALQAVSGFSVGDRTVWQKTKPIHRLQGCFRIRIGRDYRLLIHWKPDEILQALDCIPRSELESWIEGRARA